MPRAPSCPPRGPRCVGDRAYALIDADPGKVVNGKHRVGRRSITCRASYVEPPQVRGTVPPVMLILLDWTCVRSDAPDADAILSAFLGHPVRLAGSTADEGALDCYSLETWGIRARLLENAGVPFEAAMGAFVDLLSMSLVTTSTLSAWVNHARRAGSTPAGFA